MIELCFVILLLLMWAGFEAICDQLQKINKTLKDKNP